MAISTPTTLNYPHKICDPIHGFIRFDEIEKQLIDSLPFQRLRYIRQMGMAYLLYPGATHSRFEHSLGVMELSSRIFDSLFRQTSAFEPEQLAYWRRIVRLASLLHDVGHLPFSHTAEAALLGERGHEDMTYRLVQSDYLKQLWKCEFFQGHNPKEDLLKVALGSRASHYRLKANDLEIMLGQIITDDHFGADRMDYLLRDALFTGVGIGRLDFPQIIDTFRLYTQEAHLGLAIAVGGLPAIESLLMARYLMFARVYHHPKARLYAHHMRRFMKRLFQNLDSEDLTFYLAQTDYTVLTAVAERARNQDMDAQIILKQIPPFEEVELTEEEMKRVLMLEEPLKATFKEDFFIDHIFCRDAGHDFLLLNERGALQPAKTFSPFLQLLSLKSDVRLFCHRAKQAAMREYIREFK